MLLKIPNIVTLHLQNVEWVTIDLICSMKNRAARFSWYNIPKREKVYDMTTTFTKNYKLHQMAVKYSERRQSIPTFSIPRPSKIDSNWEFWFEKYTSVNPVSFQVYFYSGHEFLFKELFFSKKCSLTIPSQLFQRSSKIGDVTNTVWWSFVLFLGLWSFWPSVTEQAQRNTVLTKILSAYCQAF
jgi:hypothetical protein